MPTLVIIGGGPAGLSAAIYAVRAGLDVHVLYKDDGALGKADRIENYFGFPDVIPGAELLARGQAQADRLVRGWHRTEVTGIEYADRGFAVKTTGGEAPCGRGAARDRLSARRPRYYGHPHVRRTRRELLRGLRCVFLSRQGGRRARSGRIRPRGGACAASGRRLGHAPDERPERT